ncbi:hypothetical protein AXF42_Ash016390 [Apostasia shenzhenica]|uniref:Uncharacterized protein n=1 Tax=Apostasia shenzhenica TaxID=1088818 RepID=A0A2I0A013_9ASPA|nr:hypothetical protein AXF42_Ash016390 [Apostasia shenzhenica]
MIIMPNQIRAAAYARAAPFFRVSPRQVRGKGKVFSLSPSWFSLSPAPLCSPVPPSPAAAAAACSWRRRRGRRKKKKEREAAAVERKKENKGKAISGFLSIDW